MFLPYTEQGLYINMVSLTSPLASFRQTQDDINVLLEQMKIVT